MKRTAIIMAGGSGERFWPLSRREKPKQLLNLDNPNKTMIEESIDRISPLISPEDVFIITGEHLLEPLRAALPKVPPQNIVAEPSKRNTAPCLALAAAFIAERYPELKHNEISISVLTADQCISPEASFIDSVVSILEYVESNNILGTIGVPPSRPETGYGYIETGDLVSNLFSSPIFKAKSFREKPDYIAAEQFVNAGTFLWNSGMFFWRLDNFIEAMKTNLPDVGNKISNMQTPLKCKTNNIFQALPEEIAELFSTFPSVSIDVGLMEKADNVAVGSALFKWDDIGSWDSLERTRIPDNQGNITVGDLSVIDTTNSIIINESKGKIITAALGLDNIVIVVTDDAVMVCPKDRVQEVKKNVEQIRSFGGEKWL